MSTATQAAEPSFEIGWRLGTTAADRSAMEAEAAEMMARLDEIDPDKRLPNLELLSTHWLIARSDLDVDGTAAWSMRTKEAIEKLARETRATTDTGALNEAKRSSKWSVPLRTQDVSMFVEELEQLAAASVGRPISSHAAPLALTADTPGNSRSLAEYHAGQGFPVTELLPNSAQAFRRKWQLNATTDPKNVRKNWLMGSSYNVGIVTGRPYRDTGLYLVAIDVDNKDGKNGDEVLRQLEEKLGPLPPTRTVRTPSGGRHLLLLSRAPVGCSHSKIGREFGKGIDVKGWHGQVAAPGSVKNGFPYFVELDLPIADMPEAWERTCGSPTPRAADSQTALVELDKSQAIDRAACFLKRQDEGSDLGSYKTACWVKDYGISQEQTLELIMDHWFLAASKGENHIAEKVAHAYAYGTSPPGIKSAEYEFDAVSVSDRGPPANLKTTERLDDSNESDMPPSSDAERAPKRKGLFGVDFDDTTLDADRPYLIEDVIDAESMVVTYGSSNTGKSYVALDQAFHIASGREWNGHKVKQGLVVYVAAEGHEGFKRRIVAFRKHYEARNVPFVLVPCPIDLQSERADTRALVKLVQEAEERFNQKCVLVVIDTLARAMAGGDENTATDMGRFVDHCDRIRTTLRCAANIIHHTGKDKSKGARGSSALRAATDTEIEIAAGTMKIAKQRDMMPTPSRRFTLKSVTIGQREDGKAITACIVEWSAESEFEVRVSEQARGFLSVLEQLVAEKMDALDNPEADKEEMGIPWKEWETAGLASLIGVRGKPISRGVLFRLRSELSQSGATTLNKQNQWVISC